MTSKLYDEAHRQQRQLDSLRAAAFDLLSDELTLAELHRRVCEDWGECERRDLALVLRELLDGCDVARVGAEYLRRDLERA